MEESEIHVPLYYVLGRKITEDSLCAAYVVFGVTPCHTGIVSRHSDRTLIQPLVNEVLQAADENACKELAAHVARASYCPVLTVGEGDNLKAVYPCGKEEQICLSKQTAMS